MAADSARQILYVGGVFSHVGLPAPNGSGIDVATGRPQASFPSANGTIDCVVSDGSGGWYIGGEFTAVGGLTRNRIAHIHSDGTVDGWNPNADSSVLAIATSGSSVYVAGLFTSVGGQSRSHLAALNTGNGVATPWNPGPDGPVYAITLADSFVYAGGNFYNIGGQAIGILTRVDTGTGHADASWQAGITSVPTTYGVTGIAVSPSTVYVVGGFTAAYGGSVGVSTRYFIAGFYKSNGTLKSWHPNAAGAGNSFNAVAISGRNVYVGGNFSGFALDAVVRNNVAAFDTGTGLATSWNPDVNGVVFALQVVGSTIYIGGDFTTVGGQVRHHFAAIDSTSGNSLPWVDANGRVYALNVSGPTMYAGGTFTLVGRARPSLAAIDAATGMATDWYPVPNGNLVFSLALAGPHVFAAGTFWNGAQVSNYIAKMDTAGGIISAWSPNPNNTVRSLIFAGGDLYAGGDFTSIGGQTRNYIARLDTATGLATSWNANANSAIYGMAQSGGKIFVGGQFTSIGGASRNYIASLDTTTGNATSWNPNVSGGGMGSPVYAVALAGNTIYAGGDFGLIGDSARARIAEIDTVTGRATGWKPTGVNDIVRTISVTSSTVYAGGEFTSAGGLTRNHAVGLDRATGAVTNWDPNANSSVRAIFVLAPQATIYIGGTYTGISGSGPGYFAGVTDPNNSALPVELASFIVSARGRLVTLGWTTATETNSYIFEVERKVISDFRMSTADWKLAGSVVGAGTRNGTATYTFVDRDVPMGKWTYRLKQIDRSGSFTYSREVQVEIGAAPKEFTLGQNYPNPFNPTTNISFSVPNDGFVSLKVYDMLGREVATLVNGEKKAGMIQQVTFDATKLPSGIYFARLQSGGKQIIRKMILTK